MNPGSIPAKTDAGRQEMAERSGGLTAVQRRLLIMVDGKKTVSELLAYVRIGELDSAVEYLLALGLVALTGEVLPLQPPAGQGFASSRAMELSRPANSPQEFALVRQQTSRFVEQRLGSAGAPICAAIDRCNSPHELRSLLRGIEVFVGQRLDPKTTQEFARHFGALLL